MRTFSPEQLRNLREVFDVLDEDGSGVITADELFAVLRKIEPTATIQAAEAMIREVDADGDRVIRFDEFKAMMEAKLNQPSGVADMLRLLDLDRNGVLTRAEIRDALQRMDMLVLEDDIDEMMRTCDRGGKGHVTAADLAAMFVEAGVSTDPAGRRTSAAAGQAQAKPPL